MSADNKPLAAFKAQCAHGQNVFRAKNAAYGNAIERTGVLGAVVEIIGAAARLPQLVLKSYTHGRNSREALENVLVDIHNYAGIALMMLEKDNWEGN